MEKDFWHERWEKDEIAFHMREVNPMLIKHFPTLKLEKKRRIFIPLCGKTVDIEWLLQSGYEVVGIELNQSAVEELFLELGYKAVIKRADKLALYEAENIKIFTGDFFDLTREILGSIDLVYDRAALTALPKEMRDSYVSHLLKVTNKTPQLLITYEYDQSIMNGPPFCVDFNEIDEHYFNTHSITLLDENEDLPSGLKRKSQANEKVWLLK